MNRIKRSIHKRASLALLLLLVACTTTHSVHLSECTDAIYNPASDSVYFHESLKAERCLETHAPSVHQLPTYQDVSLLIGVKTSVVFGADTRSAIRRTWARDLPAGIRVVFLGCQPDLSQFDPAEAKFVSEQIESERDDYGDLLIDELVDCQDSLQQLVHKVMAFFQWSATVSEPTGVAKSYVMVVDDDVYLRPDGLVSLLRRHSVPSERFYGGQVWATQYNRAVAPRRRPITHKYYLSRDDYAMDSLPPFANGPHYLLSTDVASFLGQHRHIFRGVGGTNQTGGTLDDISTAIWLLAMQIHPQHLPQFSNLRDTMCRNDLVSYADLSILALDTIDANVQANRSMCIGFSYETWLKHATTNTARSRLGLSDERLRSQFQLLDHRWRVGINATTLQVTITVEFIRLGHEETALVGFIPTITSFETFCRVSTEHVDRILHLLQDEIRFMCEQLRPSLVDALHRPKLGQFKHTVMSLALHNTKSYGLFPTLFVRTPVGLRQWRVIIECLLTQSYPGAEIIILEEGETDESLSRAPDLLVFTLGDEDGDPIAKMRSYVEEYSATSRLLTITSVSVPLVDGVMAISIANSTSSALYIPLASMAFATSMDHSPMDLLQQPDTREKKTHVTPPHFCIDDYLHRACGQPHRDYFFRLLNNLDHVDILGECDSVRGQEDRATTANLADYSSSLVAQLLDRKVDSFRQYKFVLAFEDTLHTVGGISDTLVAAFLAGAVPIYYGHSPTAAAVFNTKALIDCGSFQSLRACANHVLAVHASPSLYQTMRREPPVANRSTFLDAFSWHPVVANASAVEQRETLPQRFKDMMDRA